MRRSKRRKEVDHPRTVKSAARVLDIFELLLQEPGGLSLTEISRHLGIPASSSHALVQTLISRGYLVRSDDLLIRLGPKLCQYAAIFTDHLELIDVAEPIMDRVSQLCGRTVSLAILEGNEVVFTHKKVARGTLHVVNPVGTRLPAHATGLGKSILALLSPKELDQLYPTDHLKQLTPHTITDKKTLLSVLDRVWQTGVAYDREESALGIFAVASAIRDHRGKPVAALSIVLPAAQVTEALQRRWAALINAAAVVISYRLGYVIPDSPEMPDVDRLTQAWLQGE